MRAGGRQRGPLVMRARRERRRRIDDDSGGLVAVFGGVAILE
jgi:hypothetical protein